jgi:YjbE family integral membrane protein
VGVYALESLLLNLTDPAWLWKMFTAIMAITIIDLVLSGDNAAVIGLAIRDLPHDLQKKAAIYGAAGAIVLRVIFTIFATYLLTVPYLSAIGGLILIGIMFKLIKHDDGGEDENIKSSDSFWPAIGTIIIADLSMAFDNVMGVAGAAHGSVGLVVFGLLLSIPILVFGATWLATLMGKYPIIIYIGAAVLAHTAFAMIFHDKALNLTNYTGELLGNIIPWALAALVLAYGFYVVQKTKNKYDTNSVNVD